MGPKPKQDKPEMAHYKKRQVRVVFTRKMEERQVFMEELQEARLETMKRVLRSMTKSIGPSWYQVLTLRHRAALDSMETYLHCDVLEGLPVRTFHAIHILGIQPTPSLNDVSECLLMCKEQPMHFFAGLFFKMYQHDISSMRYKYDLNGRMIMSSIFYLGLEDLKSHLTDMFKPDRELLPPPKPSKEPPKPLHPSPYLRSATKTKFYMPTFPKRPAPAPLPDLSHLKVPYVELPTVPRSPPPPPPSPPPKTCLPRTYCDTLADYKPYVPPPKLKSKGTEDQNILKGKKFRLQLATENKAYGLNLPPIKTNKHKKKFKPPSTGLENVQYTILGVLTRGENKYFIIGNVVTISAHGIIIHGGHTYCQELNTFILVNKGIADFRREHQPDPCDCLKKLGHAGIRHVMKNKCTCEHRYDFHHEDTLPEEDADLYFEKPSRISQFQFKHDNIFEMREDIIKTGQLAEKAKDDDSFLQSDIASDDIEAIRKRKRKMGEKDRSAYRSPTCLDETNPRSEDYLRCSLMQLRWVSVAARLPDLHRTPELREWMRYRLHGPCSSALKKRYLIKSTDRWTFLNMLENAGLGRVKATRDLNYSVTTWADKLKLNQKFKKHIFKQFQRKMYRAQAYRNNLLWATMYQSMFPDKKFREIFFSYAFGHVSDVLLVNPYCPMESELRGITMQKNKYSCQHKAAKELALFGHMN